MRQMRSTLAVTFCFTYMTIGQAADILIQGGTVVNADGEQQADVLIKNNRVSTIAQAIEPPRGATVIDARNKYVMPGGIDPHTHLYFFMSGRTGVDDFYSGQKAALAGGTTFHIDFAQPLDGSLTDGLRNCQEKAKIAIMDYGFHMTITKWTDKVAKEMKTLVDAGVNSFKFFMAYKGGLMVDDDLYLRGLARCKELGALPMVHAENGDAIQFAQEALIAQGITGPEGHSMSRPAYIEGEGTSRAVKLARLVNAPLYVVHINSQDAAVEIEAGLAAGQRLFGEALAGGISVSDEKCWDPDFKIAAAHVMSPPLRSKPHQTALKKALAEGKLQLIGTDHCGWNSTQKAMGRHDFRAIPNGIHGIEERLHIAWEELVNAGLISRSDFVRLTSTQAAKIFNIYPQKGVIAPGSDADIIIFDPDLTHTLSAKTHFSNIDTNIWEGRRITGKVTTTISRGRIAYQDGKVKVEQGSGQYIKLKPFAPAAFEGLEEEGAARLKALFPYGDVPVKRTAASLPKDEL